MIGKHYNTESQALFHILDYRFSLTQSVSDHIALTTFLLHEILPQT